MQALRKQARARLSPRTARKMKHALLLISSPFVFSLIINTKLLGITGKIGLGMLSVLSYAYYYWTDSESEDEAKDKETLDGETNKVQEGGEDKILDSQISQLEHSIFGENLTPSQRKSFDSSVPVTTGNVEIKKSEARVAFQHFSNLEKSTMSRQISTKIEDGKTEETRTQAVSYKRFPPQESKQSKTHISTTTTAKSKAQMDGLKKPSSPKYEGVPGSKTTLTLYTRSTDNLSTTASESRSSMSSTTRVTQKTSQKSSVKGSVRVAPKAVEEDFTAYTRQAAPVSKYVPKTEDSTKDRSYKPITLKASTDKTNQTTVVTTTTNVEEISSGTASGTLKPSEIAAIEGQKVAALKTSYLRRTSQPEKHEIKTTIDAMQRKMSADERVPERISYEHIPDKVSYESSLKPQKSSVSHKSVQKTTMKGGEVSTVITTQQTTMMNGHEDTSTTTSKQSYSLKAASRAGKEPLKISIKSNEPISPVRASAEQISPEMSSVQETYVSQSQIPRKSSSSGDFTDLKGTKVSQSIITEESQRSTTIHDLPSSSTSPFQPYATSTPPGSPVKEFAISESQAAIDYRENWKNSTLTEEEYFQRFGVHNVVSSDEYLRKYVRRTDPAVEPTEQMDIAPREGTVAEVAADYEAMPYREAPASPDVIIPGSPGYDDTRARFESLDLDGNYIPKSSEQIQSAPDYSDVRAKFLEQENKAKELAEQEETWKLTLAEKAAARKEAEVVRVKLRSKLENKLSTVFTEESVAQYRERTETPGVRQHVYKTQMSQSSDIVDAAKESEESSGYNSHVESKYNQETSYNQESAEQSEASGIDQTTSSVKDRMKAFEKKICHPRVNIPELEENQTFEQQQITVALAAPSKTAPVKPQRSVKSISGKSLPQRKLSPAARKMSPASQRKVSPAAEKRMSPIVPRKPSPAVLKKVSPAQHVSPPESLPVQPSLAPEVVESITTEPIAPVAPAPPPPPPLPYGRTVPSPISSAGTPSRRTPVGPTPPPPPPPPPKSFQTYKGRSQTSQKTSGSTRQSSTTSTTTKEINQSVRHEQTSVKKQQSHTFTGSQAMTNVQCQIDGGAPLLDTPLADYETAEIYHRAAIIDSQLNEALMRRQRKQEEYERQMEEAAKPEIEIKERKSVSRQHSNASTIVGRQVSHASEMENQTVYEVQKDTRALRKTPIIDDQLKQALARRQRKVEEYERQQAESDLDRDDHEDTTYMTEQSSTSQSQRSTEQVTQNTTTETQMSRTSVLETQVQRTPTGERRFRTPSSGDRRQRSTSGGRLRATPDHAAPAAQPGPMNRPLRKISAERQYTPTSDIDSDLSEALLRRQRKQAEFEQNESANLEQDITQMTDQIPNSEQQGTETTGQYDVSEQFSQNSERQSRSTMRRSTYTLEQRRSAHSSSSSSQPAVLPRFTNKVGGGKKVPAKALDAAIQRFEQSASEATGDEAPAQPTPTRARRPFTLPKKKRFGFRPKSLDRVGQETPTSEADDNLPVFVRRNRPMSPAFAAYQDRLLESRRSRSHPGRSPLSGGDSPYSSLAPSMSSRGSSPVGPPISYDRVAYKPPSSATHSVSSRASSPGVHMSRSLEASHLQRTVTSRAYSTQRSVTSRAYNTRELMDSEMSGFESALFSDTTAAEMNYSGAEEKVDEGLGNLPSIKSIKNRFETPEPQAPPAPAGNRSRKSSDRSVDSSSVNGDARGYRKSKWDRPKGPPPPPINRATEAEGELANSEEVTSSESTKLLVSRFREIERGDHTTYQSERKPVHKITPPRDELARGIEEAERIYQEEQTTVESGSQRQEDMPPPSITKNKLAIFRSMEEDNQAAPSPARSSYTSSSVTRTQHSVTTHSHIKASPDSGISDSEQQGTGHRSDDDLDGDVMSRSDVIRAEDKAEEDLPGQGFTKSLLAQWKQKEIQSTYSRDSSPHSTSSQQTWNSNRRVETTHRRPAKKVVQTPDSDISSADEHAYENIPPRAGGMNGDMEESEYSGSVREVIRESDRNEDDELPPPSFTKNMLAKFQSMQEEATRDTYVRPPVKKQFKWTVKETKPLHTVTTTTTKREHRTTRTYSNNSESAEYHEYEEHEGPLADTLQDEEEYSEAVQADFRADEVLEEDLPPASFTRNMLAKFRSMEDVDQEPPTPEFSSKKMKAAIISVSPSHVRRFEGGPAPVYPDGELADEVEHMDNHHQYDFDYNAAIDAGEYENDPYSNPDVIREGDVLTEDLPEQGTTRHLLAKFQSMQAS